MAEEAARKAAELQAGLLAYYEGRKALEMANKAAMEKAAAEEAARQKALEDFRMSEHDRTPVPVPAPVKEEKSWWGKAWNNILEPVVNFSVGVGYQIVRNNADSLTVAGVALLAPEKKETLKNYFQGWDQFEKNSAVSNTVSFQVGKVVGGLLGMAQGVLEIGSGIATGTGGTVISCGTVVLCIGGGGASLAWGGALVADGVAVLGASAVETGQVLGDLFNNNNNQIKSGDSISKNSNSGDNSAYVDAQKEKIVEKLKSSESQEVMKKLNGSEIEFLKEHPLCDACAIKNGVNLYPENIKGIVEIDGSHRVLVVLDDGKLITVDTSTYGTAPMLFEDQPGGLGGSPNPTSFEGFIELWNKAARIPDNHMMINPKLSVWNLGDLESALAELRWMGVIK